MSIEPITVNQANALLMTAEAAGLRPPEAYLRPAERDDQGRVLVPSGRILAARVWAQALTMGGVSFAEAERGLALYVAEPDAGQYPKAWPDPGKVIARTAVGRLALTLGTDADHAFSDFQAARLRMIARAIPDGEVRADRWDRDPLRSEAMHAGWETWPRGTSEPDPCAEFPFGQARKAWISAYTLARRSQAQDRDTCRMLVGAAQPQITGAK